jgi:hypothetical protein
LTTCCRHKIVTWSTVKGRFNLISYLERKLGFCSWNIHALVMMKSTPPRFTCWMWHVKLLLNVNGYLKIKDIWFYY